MEDGKYILGYVGLVVIGGKIVNSYLATNFYNFNSTIDHIRAKPARSIAVLSYDNEKAHGTYIENLKSRYPDAKIESIRAKDERALFEKLRLLPQEYQYDRIDWIAHGAPGVMSAGNGKLISADDLKSKTTLHIVRPGGEMRIHACSVGLESVCFPRAPAFGEQMSRIFLSEGGSVFTATKNISMLNMTPAQNRAMAKKASLIGLMGPLVSFLGLKDALTVPWRPLASIGSQFAETLEVKRLPDSECSKQFEIL